MQVDRTWAERQRRKLEKKNWDSRDRHGAQNRKVILVTINEHGCWLWNGQVTGSNRTRYNKYPTVSINKKATGLHRLMLEAKLGRRLAFKECALHKCDTPMCLNPSCLWPGTQADNIKDRDNKGRWKDHWK